MPSPFPGMDPYIERPEIWPDFHLHMVVSISRALQPLLRPGHAALIQNRCFVGEPPWYEDRRQPYLQVIEPTAENRAITVIEVFSPDNKTAGRREPRTSSSVRSCGVAVRTWSRLICCGRGSRR